jgi:hypothetical protein
MGWGSRECWVVFKGGYDGLEFPISTYVTSQGAKDGDKCMLEGCCCDSCKLIRPRRVDLLSPCPVLTFVLFLSTLLIIYFGRSPSHVTRLDTP